jgi:hypothetical protein
MSNEKARAVSILYEDQQRLWALFRQHPQVLERAGLLKGSEARPFIEQGCAERLLSDIQDFGHHAKLDCSRAPSDIARWQILEHEIRCSAKFADSAFRLKLCVHEALHAVYYERAGFHSVRIGGPYIKASGTEYADACIADLEPREKLDRMSNLNCVLVTIAPEHGDTELKQYGIETSDGYDSDRNNLYSHFPGGFEALELQDHVCVEARRIITEDCNNETFRNDLMKKALEFKINLEEIVFGEPGEIFAYA